MENNHTLKWYSCSSYIQGITHIRLGLPCQDYARAETINGVQMAALSDGCGSSEVSQIGSRLTVDFIMDFIPAEFNNIFSMTEIEAKKYILGKLILKYTEYIRNNPTFAEDYVSEHPGSSLVADVLKQYSGDRKTALQMLGYQLLDSTLIFVAIKGRRRLTVHIGDGFIIGVKECGLFILHEERKNPDLPENATVYPFDIYSDIASMDDFYFSKETDGNRFSLIALSSDGLDSLIEKPNPKDKETFGKKYVNKTLIETLAEFALNDNGTNLLCEKLDCLKQDNKNGFVLSSNFDDCSLAILRRREIGILWSFPTRIGNGDQPLEPKLFLPGLRLPGIANTPSTKQRVFDLLNYYSAEDPSVIFNVSKILDNREGSEGIKNIESHDLRIALNAIEEFDLNVQSDE